MLVLHPGASVQAAYRHPRRAEEEAAAWSLSEVSMPYQSVERHFAMLSSALLDAQIDFDYGDEILLARYAVAERKRIEVSAMAYRIVVLPPMLNMRETTLHLLEDFAIGGGVVLALGTVAALVDALQRFWDLDLAEVVVLVDDVREGFLGGGVGGHKVLRSVARNGARTCARSYKVS